MNDRVHDSILLRTARGDYLGEPIRRHSLKAGNFRRPYRNSEKNL